MQFRSSSHPHPLYGHLAAIFGGSCANAAPVLHFDIILTRGPLSTTRLDDTVAQGPIGLEAEALAIYATSRRAPFQTRSNELAMPSASP
jgi:hypothetical protein